MKDRSEAAVARGATSLYLSSVILLFANTAYFATLTNLLPTTQIGVIAGLQILIWAIATLSNLALPQTIATNLPLPPAVAKLVPEFISAGRGGKASQVFKLSLLVSITVSVVLAATVALGAGWLRETVFQGAAEPLWLQLVAIDSFFFTLGQFLVMTLVGLNKTAKAGIYSTVSFTLKYVLGAVLAWGGWGVAGVFTAHIAGDAVMVFLCSRSAADLRRVPVEHLSLLDVARYSVPVLVSSLVVFGVTQLDKIFALFRLTLADLGVYNVAVAASAIAAFAPSAITLALVPVLSSYFAKGSSESFLKLARQYTRYVSLVAIPMSFEVSALAPALTQLFGAHYVAASASVAILSAATGITAVSSIHNACLLSAQNAWKVMRANVLGLAVFAVLAVLLTPTLSFEGLAWSRAVMILVIAGLITFDARKGGFSVVDLEAFASSLVGSVIMAAVLFGIVNAIGGYRTLLVLLPLLIPLGGLIYFMVLRILRTFNSDDMEFLRSLTPRRLEFLVEWAGKIAGVRAPDSEKSAS